MDDPEPTPKKPRPSFVEPPSNAVAGPSRLRDQELGLDLPSQVEEAAPRTVEEAEAENVAVEAERDESLRVSRERDAAVSSRFVRIQIENFLPRY